MPLSPPPHAPDRRQITLVRCGKSPSRNVVLDEWISDQEALPPQHTLILHECILLARRTVFTAIGANLTAQALLEGWMSSQSPDDTDATLAKAITGVKSFANEHTVTVVVDNSTRECTKLERGDFMRLTLKFDLARAAAEAEAQSLASGATLESRMRRHRQVFFIALAIANTTQQAIRRATNKIDPFAHFDSLDDSSQYRCGNSSHWTDRIDPKLRPDAGGCRFEELMFGGSVVREMAISRRGDDTEWLRGAITGLVVITTQDGVSGYRRIPDDVIKLIVEDSDGLERYLPLKQDCLGEFVPGPPSQPAYRTGVGSKELYKRVYSRAAMRAGVLFRDPALFEARTRSLVGDYTRRYTPYQP